MAKNKTIREDKVRGLVNSLVRQRAAYLRSGDASAAARRGGRAAEGITEAEVHEVIGRYNRRLGRR